MKKILDFWAKIWDNPIVLICISIALAIIFIPIFSNVIAYYIFFLIIALGVSIGLDQKYIFGFTKILFIAIVIVIILTIILSLIVGDTFKDNHNGNDSDACGICGGSGIVTFKLLGEGTGIQVGFDTYYRCKGCHGSGRK